MARHINRRAFVCAGTPVKISVERLFGHDIEVIEVDQRLRLGDELAARYPDGVHVVATVRRIQRGAYIEGHVEGREVETCARCLEPFVRLTRVQIEEPFSEDVRPQDAQFSDIAPLVDRSIDLDELVEQLLGSMNRSRRCARRIAAGSASAAARTRTASSAPAASTRSTRACKAWRNSYKNPE